METQIALLRGINVSGQKLIKMDRLRAIFELLPFRQVRTYIQSGNVIFQSAENDTAIVRQAAEAKLAAELGYKVAAVVVSRRELEDVIRRSPFDVSVLNEDEKLYVTFLAEQPSAEAVAALEAVQSDVDIYRVQGKQVYIVCRQSYGKSLFSNNFLEKKLQVAATTRNWQTVTKIAAIAATEQ